MVPNWARCRKEDSDVLYLFSGTFFCVEYLLAWMPTFCAWSRVTLMSVISSLRTRALRSTHLDQYSKPTSAARLPRICSHAFPRFSCLPGAIKTLDRPLTKALGAI